MKSIINFFKTWYYRRLFLKMYNHQMFKEGKSPNDAYIYACDYVETYKELNRYIFNSQQISSSQVEQGELQEQRS